MDENDFAKQMDVQNPEWFIQLANEQELKGFAKRINFNKGDTDIALNIMKISVTSRLFICARAAYHVLREQS